MTPFSCQFPTELRITNNSVKFAENFRLPLARLHPSGIEKDIIYAERMDCFAKRNDENLGFFL